jgi:uncharacterized protein
MSAVDAVISRGLEVRYRESRPEIRSTETGTVEFRGFATSYETWYDVAGGIERGGWEEMVTAGAGRRTLNTRPDVRLLVNHDGIPLARTRSGTLELEEQDAGLYVFAPALDLRNPTVQEVQSAMDRRDLDEMSFAFRATRQEWNADYTQRTIREYALDVDGSDVSIVTYPANKATIAQLRSAAKVDEYRSALKAPGSPFGITLAEARALRNTR